MINVDQIIQWARKRYDDDGVTLTLPFQNREPSSPTHIRPSSVGLCPLKAAYDKAGRKPDYDTDGDGTQTWIMSHGLYVAPMIQLPLMWWAMQNQQVTFTPEVVVKAPLWGKNISGRADGVLEVGNERCVLEIKDTEGKKLRSVGEPTLRYVWQTLLYMKLLGISQGAIITVGKWGYTVWDLLPTDGGYRVFDKKGNPYQPLYGGDWNTTSIIRDTELNNVLQQHYDLLLKVNQHPGQVQPPPLDPLNGDLSWLCTSQWEKPTEKKPTGKAFPNCCYALSCHGMKDQMYRTKKDPITKRIEFADSL